MHVEDRMMATNVAKTLLVLAGVAIALIAVSVSLV